LKHYSFRVEVKDDHLLVRAKNTQTKDVYVGKLEAKENLPPIAKLRIALGNALQEKDSGHVTLSTQVTEEKLKLELILKSEYLADTRIPIQLERQPLGEIDKLKEIVYDLQKELAEFKKRLTLSCRRIPVGDCGNPSQPPPYYCRFNDRVTLRGTICQNNGPVPFTLAEGFRPFELLKFPTEHGHQHPHRIEVYPDGQVKLPGGHHSLDGISFFVRLPKWEDS